jgi:hypothetical protein
MLLEDLRKVDTRMIEAGPCGYVLNTSVDHVVVPDNDTITDHTFSAMTHFNGFTKDGVDGGDVDFSTKVDYKYSLAGATEFAKLKMVKVHPVSTANMDDELDMMVIETFNDNLYKFTIFDTEPVKDELENNELFMNFLSYENYGVKDED